MEGHKRDNNKRYRKAVRKALMTLAALIVIVLSVVWAQAHDYVGTFIKAKMSSGEALEQNSEQAMAELEEKLDRLESAVQAEPSDTTAETESGGQDGQSGQAAQNEAPEPAGETSPQAATAGGTDCSAALEQHCAALKALKDSFTLKLEAIVQSARDEYAALPADERTNENKISIVMDKKGELEALESDCDARVASEVSAISDLLAQSGRDTSLADDIQKAYEDMKDAKKAEYINKLYA